MKRIWRDWQFLAALVVPLFGMIAVRVVTGWRAPLPVGPPPRLLLQLLGLVLIWPIMEETIFRGALQPYFSEQSWGQWRLARVTVANLFVSLLFAAAHLFSHSPYWSAAVFFPSLVFGYFRDRYNALLPAMVLHVSYNLGYYGLFT